MTNSSLKQRIEEQAAALATALQAPSAALPDQLRTLAAQLELAADSLERPPAGLRARGFALARDLVKEAEIHEDGFQTDAQDLLMALKEWLAEIPE